MVRTLCFLLLGALLFPALLPAQAAKDFAGRIVHVSDGDTVTVLTAERREVKVRLHGIDAPEAAQPFGQAARRYALEIAAGQTVTVVPVGSDRYQRLVAEVLLADGTSLNRALVSAGLAWWYRRYAPDDADLAAREAQAQQARRGLWAEPAPVPPWEWRARKTP